MPVVPTPLEGATAHVVDGSTLWRDAPSDAVLEDPRAEVKFETGLVFPHPSADLEGHSEAPEPAALVQALKRC